ncbi:MAG: glycosyltransferase family 4 protein [Pseudomonadales bacterium]|nr:glycosyltransferase family 4 protein [Pseudomonadales bacterium]
MQIGLDISPIIYGRGVSRYTSNLARSLLAAGQALSLYGSSFRQHKQLESMADELLAHHQNSSTVIRQLPPGLQQLAWRWGLAPVGARLPTIDVFHSWDWMQPPDKGLPLVSTIHDLAMLKYPDTAHPRILKAHQRSWKILGERNAHIIAVSRATKKDVVELLGIPDYRVHVVPEALPLEVKVQSDQLTQEAVEYVSKKYQLDRPYILFVGTREPRKNLKRLIKAWQPLASEVQLIIAGESGWDNSERISNNPHLRFLGRVSDATLSVLYAQAELVAYPSLYEGFGLPILEAFEYGTPVVTANISSMPEVAGNAAVLVDPLEVESIRSGITEILGESAQQQKVRLQRMIIRKQLFDWETVTDATVQVYQKALDEHS